MHFPAAYVTKPELTNWWRVATFGAQVIIAFGSSQ